MIFSLVGPPAAGKSTISEALIKEILNLEYLDIARFRQQFQYQKEKEAWKKLLEASRAAQTAKKHLLIETSGLSHQLQEIVIPCLRSLKGTTFTIALLGDEEPLLSRLKQRQENFGLPTNIREDEQAFLSYSIPKIDQLPTDIFIDTTEERPEDTVKVVRSFILDKCWMTNLRKVKEDSGRNSISSIHDPYNMEDVYI